MIPSMSKSQYMNQFHKIHVMLVFRQLIYRSSSHTVYMVLPSLECLMQYSPKILKSFMFRALHNNYSHFQLNKYSKKVTSNPKMILKIETKIYKTYLEKILRIDKNKNKILRN